VLTGDLGELSAAQRAEYYAAVCQSLGLNPLTQPFAYLTLNGKLRLYALRDCADQLRRLHGISIYIANREKIGDIYVVTARAKDKTGREDESTGAVPLGTLKGDALANALMKCETKAKRRVTLSIAGLGWLDETELETVKGVITGAPEAPVATIRDASLEETPSPEPAEAVEPPAPGSAHLDARRQERQAASPKPPAGNGAADIPADVLEVIRAILARVVALYPGDKTDATVIEDRKNMLQTIFGCEIDSGMAGVHTLAALGREALDTGRAKLARLERETPPPADTGTDADADDQPEHPDLGATRDLVASLRRRATNLSLAERFEAWLQAGAGTAVDGQGRLLLSAAERARLSTAFNDFLAQAQAKQPAARPAGRRATRS
jgi:hypothetical protein